MVAVAVSSSKESVEKMMKDEGVNYPVYFAPERLSSTYRVASLPTTYVVNRDGAIVASSVGYSPGWEMERLLSAAE